MTEVDVVALQPDDEWIRRLPLSILRFCELGGERGIFGVG